MAGEGPERREQEETEMTIRELEQKSGLERANIRFYEKAKLLNPVRRENGYRDYSEGDLETLRRICLLRRLQFSVEEFAENYNFYAEYYKDDFWNKKLNEEGEWADASTDIVYQFPASFRWPDFSFEEEDGILTGMTVRIKFDGSGELMDTFQMQQQIAALAFAGAAKDAHLSAWTALRLGDRLDVQENGSLSFEEAGTEFSLHTEMENYRQWSGNYLMGEGEGAWYLREFTMRYAE